jgi:hypothetical protein
MQPCNVTRILANFVVGLCVAVQISAMAGDPWQAKPYTEWTESEALKVLQDSPWSRTAFIQLRPGGVATVIPSEGVSGDLSGRQHSTCCNTLGSEGGVDRTTAPVGETVSAGGPVTGVRVIYFRVLCFSSVRIRQALTRLKQLSGAALDPHSMQSLQGPLDDIVIAVAGPYVGLFERAAVDDLRRSTSLRSKKGSGASLELKDFVSPAVRKDGMALFIFPRAVNGQPAFDVTDGQVEFTTGEGAFKIQVSFKLEKMAVAGALDF